MANSVLSEDRFQNEDAAFAFVEAALWPNGPNCPHCGNADPNRIRKMEGKTTRRGLYNCRECRNPFTVRMGTIFESSHLALHLWLQIIHLMCASKKGISTNQIQRMLRCSMKTAWFLGHRIREAMRDGSLAPMGGAGGVVEIDETFIGKKEGFENDEVLATRTSCFLSSSEAARFAASTLKALSAKISFDRQGEHRQRNPCHVRRE
jgi:transposase-like protein